MLAPDGTSGRETTGWRIDFRVTGMSMGIKELIVDKVTLGG